MITNIVNTVIIWCLISYCFSCKVVESEVAVYEKDILYNKLTQNSPPYYTCIIFEEAHERGDWQTILNCSDYKLILANRLSTDSVGFKILLDTLNNMPKDSFQKLLNELSKPWLIKELPYHKDKKYTRRARKRDKLIKIEQQVYKKKSLAKVNIGEMVYFLKRGNNNLWIIYITKNILYD